MQPNTSHTSATTMEDVDNKIGHQIPFEKPDIEHIEGRCVASIALLTTHTTWPAPFADGVFDHFTLSGPAQTLPATVARS